MKIPFSGRLLILGCGSVSQCLQPLLLRHLQMDFSKLTVLDFADQRTKIPETLASGATYRQHRITPDNLTETLATHVSAGDLVIDLAWNIGANDIIQWCHDNNVLYLNTSVEVWDPYHDLLQTSPINRTLYVRHHALRRMAAGWQSPGVTAVVEHGANPGLVSHWTKLGLQDIAQAMLRRGRPQDQVRRKRLEKALQAFDYPRIAQETGTKVIHISERDTQISSAPKEPDEFVNTWSVEGFYEEGIAPAELGWGTHERRLPAGAHFHRFGPGNQICLAQPGMNTLVHSWVPQGGEILGMVIRHGESFTISDYLTVWDDHQPVYRPTVHYAYLPSDSAIASIHELKMRNWEMQTRQRILNDEITSGQDELGVLLLGHDLNGWWIGSQLDIASSRNLVPHQNATTLQVAASILGALVWMLRNPQRGLCLPDQLPPTEILAVANPYLGNCVSVQTDWNPLQNRFDPFAHYSKPAPNPEDIWQFISFLAP
jgi:homospermidine synthase